MEHEGLSWIEAVKWIADFYGMPMQEIPASPEEEARAAARKEALGQLSSACIEYQSLLSATPSVMEYLNRDRGLTTDIIERFQLGYGGDKGTFRGRVIFPVHDKQGRCVGFGGRVLPESVGTSCDLSGETSLMSPCAPATPEAKYLNSAESDMYKKSNLLYGLHLAKGAITRKQVAYLVEGYTDVLMMHQHGYTNCVGTCGTALTAQQVRLLKPYTKHIVVLFDGDAPGQKAAVRAIDVLLAGGMVVDVVRLPKGLDPAEFLLSASSTSTCVEDLCEDFVGYILGCIPAGADVPVKVAGQKRVIEAIAKISDHLYRRGYVEELCTRTGLVVEDVMREMERAAAANGSSKETALKGTSKPSGSKASPSKTSFNDATTCAIPYRGAYPIVLDIPVDKEWHDHWCHVDKKMRYVGSTVNEVVALETDIVATVLLEMIVEDDNVHAHTHTPLTIPNLMIPALNKIIHHLVYQKELSIEDMELMMHIQANMAVYSEQRYYPKNADRVMVLEGIVDSYCGWVERMRRREF